MRRRARSSASSPPRRAPGRDHNRSPPASAARPWILSSRPRMPSNELHLPRGCPLGTDTLDLRAATEIARQGSGFASTHHGKRAHLIAVPHRAAAHRVLELHLEAARRSNATDSAQRSAEHERAGLERAVLPSRQEICGGAHRRKRPLLIVDAFARDRRERSEEHMSELQSPYEIE